MCIGAPRGFCREDSAAYTSRRGEDVTEDKCVRRSREDERHEFPGNFVSHAPVTRQSECFTQRVPARGASSAWMKEMPQLPARDQLLLDLIAPSEPAHAQRQARMLQVRLPSVRRLLRWRPCAIAPAWLPWLRLLPRLAHAR